MNIGDMSTRQMREQLSQMNDIDLIRLKTLLYDEIDARPMAEHCLTLDRRLQANYEGVQCVANDGSERAVSQSCE